jgi:thiol-disulfide isomerase/thioredoxin
MLRMRRSFLPQSITASLGLALSFFAAETVAPHTAAAADTPSAKLALSFRPMQKDVDYDIPDEKDVEKCKVEVERIGKASGWVVLNPNGAILRRFVDTNSDNVVDQWRYYKNGLEVYRDVDSNYNNKVDQSRWMNTAGTRWGLDTNEDGRIDRWKTLSAEEASREAVKALAARDEAALTAVLVDKDDLKTLRFDEEMAGKISESVANPGKKMQANLAASKSFDPKMKWMRLDVSQPSLVPSDDGKAEIDLLVYENAMAIVEADGKTAILQIGELVKVGDVWKLTQIPVPLEGTQVQLAAGLLLQPPALTTGGNAPMGTSASKVSPEVEKKLKDLQELDKKAPSPNDSAKAIARYNVQRADLLEEIVKMVPAADKEQWIRQMVDGVAAAVQTNQFEDGVKRLQRSESDAKESGNKSLLAYVTYRRMLAEYTLNLQNVASAKRQEVQDNWLKDLETFAKAYPDGEDAPDAVLQLAIAQEFGGKVSEAKKWYETIVAKYPKSAQAPKASGSLRRFELKGKSFQLSGAGLKGGKIDSRDFRGKTLLVLYWASWCQPCTEELPQLKELYQQYKGQGFEILGVNLDNTPNLATGYLTEQKVPAWPQIHEAGGLDSPPSIALGIISLPTMILVDADGVVHTRSVSISDLKQLLPDMVKAKKK